MNEKLLGIAAAKVFLGFLACFGVGLRTCVGGHFPVARAIFASSAAAALGLVVAGLGSAPAARAAYPVAFLIAVIVAYRPRWTLMPVALAFAAAVEFGLAFA